MHVTYTRKESRAKVLVSIFMTRFYRRSRGLSPRRREARGQTTEEIMKTANVRDLQKSKECVDIAGRLSSRVVSKLAALS